MITITVFISKLKVKLHDSNMEMSIKQNGAFHVHSEGFGFLGEIIMSRFSEFHQI
jgi:hypothetical protein